MTWAREDWTCENGHPLYLIDGEKICTKCPKLAGAGRLVKCKRGHVYPAPYCRTCSSYYSAPWLGVLDETGETYCPGGHYHTHETLTYLARPGGGAERKCGLCIASSLKSASKAYSEMQSEDRKRTGRKYTIKKRLPNTFVDWVVVQRMIDGKVDEVHQMVRDDSRGPTLMERWVAVCSTPKWHPFMRSADENHSSDRRPFWERIGHNMGWEPKTIADVLME